MFTYGIPILFFTCIAVEVMVRVRRRTLYDPRFEKLFRLHPDAILLIDSKGTVKNANLGAMRLSDSIESRPERLLDLLDSEVKRRIQAKIEISQHETEITIDSNRLFLLVSADYMQIDNELHVLLILRDYTLQKQQQEEIRYLAYHDPLTKLPNRLFFQEKLDAAIQEALPLQESLAVLLVDLDKLKLLNDTRGHVAGDEALLTVARILQHVVADRGVAARLGGDEFIVYMGGSPSKQEIQEISRRIEDEFIRSVAEHSDVPAGLSIGVSYYPSDGIDAQALINIADNSMLEMKRSRA